MFFNQKVRLHAEFFNCNDSLGRKVKIKENRSPRMRMDKP